MYWGKCTGAVLESDAQKWKVDGATIWYAPHSTLGGWAYLLILVQVDPTSHNVPMLKRIFESFDDMIFGTFQWQQG